MKNSRRLVFTASLLAIFQGVAPARAQRGPEDSSELGTRRVVPLDELLAVTNTEPITVPPTSSTEAAFNARNLEWAQKRFSEALTTELRTAKMEDPAGTAQKMIQWWMMLGDRERLKLFAEDMRKAIRPDLPAPMAHLIVGDMYFSVDRKFDAEAHWRACMDQTKDGQGHPFFAALATSQLIPSDHTKKRLVELLAAALAPGQFGEDDADFLARHFWIRFKSAARRSVADQLIPIYEKSGLPAWLVQYLNGHAHWELAWTARDRGWGKPENEKRFAEEMQRAGAAFTQSWKLKPSRPEAAAMMIYVVMDGGSDDTRREWFDRSVAAEFDFLMAYDSKEKALNPREGGSRSRLLAFGLACAKTQRYETRVPATFLHVLDAVGKDVDQWQPLYRQKEIAENYLHIRQEIVRLAEQKNFPDYLHNVREYLAISALQTGNEALALETFKKLEDENG